MVKASPLARVCTEGRVPADWRPTGSPWDKRQGSGLMASRAKKAAKRQTQGDKLSSEVSYCKSYKAYRVQGIMHKGNKRLHFLLPQFVRKLKKIFRGIKSCFVSFTQDESIYLRNGRMKKEAIV